MGILADQAFRLLREEWQNPLDLAQEIYLILRNKDPLQIDGPVQITNPTDLPAVSIANTGQDGKADIFNITRPADPNLTFNDLFPGVASPTSSAPATPGGGGTPGKIVSGSGANYKVQLYPDGVTPKSTVDAVQLQIDPAEKIPAGTWVSATKVGAKYVLFVPVWL